MYIFLMREFYVIRERKHGTIMSGSIYTSKIFIKNSILCEHKINVISWLCLKNKKKKFSWELSQKRKIFIYENIMVDSFLIYHISF